MFLYHNSSSGIPCSPYKSNWSLKLKKTNRIKYKNKLDTSLYTSTQAASACVNRKGINTWQNRTKMTAERQKAKPLSF